MIVVRDLAIDAGARRLISAVSFSVQAGDKTGLVGPNGAGKTTLLRALAGLRRPASGSIVSNGVVGYLSQEAALDELADPDGTALERVLQARDIGALERRMEETRAEMEDQVGERRDRLIRRFSRLEDEFTARGGSVAKAEAKQRDLTISFSVIDFFFLACRCAVASSREARFSSRHAATSPRDVFINFHQSLCFFHLPCFSP